MLIKMKMKMNAVEYNLYFNGVKWYRPTKIELKIEEKVLYLFNSRTNNLIAKPSVLLVMGRMAGAEQTERSKYVISC